MMLSGFDQDWAATPTTTTPTSAPQPKEQNLTYQKNAALFQQLQEKTLEELRSVPCLSMWEENARENGGVASRYGNIECPTETAVDVGGHQYFHANHVGMGICEKPFVASQLPVYEDRERFWKYVMDSECTIVDLTARNTTATYDIYYPRWNQRLVIGNTWGITVQELDLTHSTNDYTAQYTVSDSTGTTKTITRYHYLEWQDNQGLEVSELTALVEKLDTFPGTVLVHCSAGVGRTGTLIAAYCAKKQILAHTMTKENVDEKSMENLLALRKQRGSSFVKSEEQFDLLIQYSNSLL